MRIGLFMCFAWFCSAGFAAEMTLTRATFAELPGWKQDHQEEALLAFQKSCVEIMKRDANYVERSRHVRVSRQEWQDVCRQAEKIHTRDVKVARRFFETNFAPYRITASGYTDGLFTGYYMPLIHARLQPDKRYFVPIYAYPAGASRWLPDREAIMNGALEGRAEVLAWADDPVDVYFAHVQGSAVVELPDKRQFVIGYAGHNGREYTSIGRVLVESQQIAKEVISMQSIRAWLEQHPRQANALLNLNKSYVFFRILKDENPLGSERVPLTPQRSLAVDLRFIPLGAPVWLNSAMPVPESKQSLLALRRLLVAQDTGGAIKGIVRGDVYWGTGDKAAYIAGHMNSPGNYWVLLP